MITSAVDAVHDKKGSKAPADTEVLARALNYKRQHFGFLKGQHPSYSDLEKKN